MKVPNISFSNFSSLENHKNSELIHYMTQVIDYKVSTNLPLLSKEENDERIKLLQDDESVNNDKNNKASSFSKGKERMTVGAKKGRQVKNISQKFTSPSSPELMVGRRTISNKSNNSTIDNRKTLMYNSPKKHKKLFDDSSFEEEMENKLDHFWSKIKQKYSNFQEINYIKDPIYLNNIYNDYIYYDDKIKTVTRNFYFNYVNFLYKQISRSVNEAWPDLIKKKMNELNSNILDNYEGFWLSAVLDFSGNKESNAINNTLKYNLDLDNKSIIITINLFYKELSRDLYIILKNRPWIDRIIVEVEQRSYWVGQNIDPIFYIQDNEWNHDMNNVFNVLLNCLLRLNKLRSFTLVLDDECTIDLSKENTEILCAILHKHKDSIEVWTTNRLRLNKSVDVQPFFLLMVNIKILILQGTQYEFNENKIKEVFSSHNRIAYIRFSRFNISTGENEED